MQLKTGRGIVLLLQFFAIASASILSGHPSSQPGLLLSDSHVSTRNGDNPIVASVLAKRFDLRFLRNRFAHTVNVGAGWIVYYNTFDVIHCISNIARNDLLRFYNLVLSLAGNDWANRAAQRTYTADFGDLTLVLSSTDPITWDFLHWFLVDMVRLKNQIFPKAVL